MNGKVWIRPLDEGAVVIDDRGPIRWECAAVSMLDAQAIAENRLHPRGPSAPPRGDVRPNSGYDETPPLAQIQFEQATGDGAQCVGGFCSLD